MSISIKVFQFPVVTGRPNEEKEIRCFNSESTLSSFRFSSYKMIEETKRLFLGGFQFENQEKSKRLAFLGLFDQP